MTKKQECTFYNCTLLLFISYFYSLSPLYNFFIKKHGKRLSVETEFTFSNEKIGDYYTGVRRVLIKIFGDREVLAYVTATEKEHGTKRLFFSTVFPKDLQIFCA